MKKKMQRLAYYARIRQEVARVQARANMKPVRLPKDLTDDGRTLGGYLVPAPMVTFIMNRYALAQLGYRLTRREYRRIFV